MVSTTDPIQGLEVLQDLMEKELEALRKTHNRDDQGLEEYMGAGICG